MRGELPVLSLYSYMHRDNLILDYNIETVFYREFSYRGEVTGESVGRNEVIPTGTFRASP
jgi:hypothetical protein